jgi:hypothetical protein
MTGECLYYKCHAPGKIEILWRCVKCEAERRPRYCSEHIHQMMVVAEGAWLPCDCGGRTMSVVTEG